MVERICVDGRTQRCALATALFFSLTIFAPGASAREPSNASPFKARSTAGESVPGELLVRFESNATPTDKARVRSRQKLQKVKDLPLPGLELVRTTGPGSMAEQAGKAAAEGSVRYAQPNFIYRAADIVPNDSGFNQLWGLHNTGQATGSPSAVSSGTVDADIDAPQAWEVASGSEQVVVGVVDTGIKIDHPDLAGTIWTNPGEVPSNGIDDDANGYVDDANGWDFVHNDKTVFDEADGEDHGTHVAGTIAGIFNNSAGVAGVSSAKIMPLKFLGYGGTGFTSDAVLALDYAIQKGAKLTNHSWSGGSFDTALRDKITAAGTAGQLVIAAAGNGGSDGNGDNLESTPSYPAAFTNSNIVAVAATDKNDALATFSNYGSTSVDLGAPGVGIYSSVPNLGKAILSGPDTGGSAYRTALHGFGLEGVISTGDRQALLGASLSWMGMAPGDPILIVDYDDGQAFETAYQTTLSALGFTNVTTTAQVSSICAVGSGPSASTMGNYRAVIWITGTDYLCTLPSSDATKLTSYLNGNGGVNRNLLLFGVDIAYYLTEDGAQTSNFLENTLRTNYLADNDDDYAPKGAAGSPYSGVPVLELTPGTAGAGQFFADILAPRTGAITGIRSTDYNWNSGTSMATPHVSGAAAQLFAAYPAATNLDIKNRLVNQGDAKASLSGKTVSGKRLNLAESLDTVGAAAISGLSATPSAIASGGTTTFNWTQNEPAKATLTVTPQGGGSAVRVATLGAKRAGSHSWVWDGKNDSAVAVAGGMYDIKVSLTDVKSNSSNGSSPVTVGAPPTVSKASADFDGDGDSDISVYRGQTGTWYPKDQASFAWGGDSSDKAVSGNYNGDGLTDAAVYRAGAGTWYIRNQFQAQWGGHPTDVPVPADYDGDGDTDLAVYRASTGTWYINRLEGLPTDISQASWGGALTDVPVPGDYDKDGDADLAVYRTGTGTWYVKDQFQAQWGGDGTDKPAPADYDGDGDTDLAVYRAATGYWYVKDQPLLEGKWGGDSSDRPAPGDYNKDGKADLTVYRSATGRWYIKNHTEVAWGGDPTDIALPWPRG